MASNAAHDELIRVAWIRADTSAVAEVHKDGRGNCAKACAAFVVYHQAAFPAEPSRRNEVRICVL